MNTKQLIILWYGSFTIFVLLFLFYVDNDSVYPLIVVTSILALVLLLFLTFRDSKTINSKKVIKSSALPLGLVLSLVFVLYILDISTRTNTYNSSVSVEDIEILSPQLTIKDQAFDNRMATFEGRLRNNSNRTLSEASFRIRMFQFDYKEFSKGSVIPVEVFLKSGYLPNVVDSFGTVGEQIDSDEFYSDYLLVGPGETKSFKIIQRYTNLKPSHSWAWDFEILSVSSSY